MSFIVGRVLAGVREDERIARVARVTGPADGATIEAGHIAPGSNEPGVE
jgi:hypothetical protein